MPVELPRGARVLIVRLGALGDIVHALPVLDALRRARPDLQVDWLVDARHAQVLGLVDGVHRRVIVRAAASRVDGDAVQFGGTGGVLAAVRHLRAQGYAAALDLQGLIKSAAWARASGARRVIGYHTAELREPVSRWLYGEQAPRSSGLHVIDRNLSVLRPLGIDTDARRFPWRAPLSASVAPQGQPAVAHADGYAILNPGAAWVNKRWPPSQFGALAALLGERLQLASVVTWAPGEEGMAAAVVAASRGHAVLAPPTSLADLLALARGARLMVSGDTGPLHLGASVGTPLVGLFGPTRPARNGPWHAEDQCVSRADRCSCLHKRHCLRGAACIESIAVEEVFAACVRRIAPMVITRA